MAVPTVPDRPDPDDIISSSWGQWVHDATVRDYQPAGCIMSTTTQTLNTGAFLNIPWTTKVRDPLGYHTTGSRLTVPAGLDGPHLLTASIQFGNQASGTQRYVEVIVNGVALVPALAVASPHLGTQYVFVALAQQILMAPGAYVELRALQDSGQQIGVLGWLSLLRLGAG